MPQKQGAGTVFTGGPGTAFRGPLYVKGGPLPGQPAAQFNYNQFMDAAGQWALQIAQATLTSAQILAMFTTPVQILAAPGAGSLIIPDFLVAELKFNTIAYAAGGAISLTFGASGPAVHTTAMPAALVTAAQSELFQSPAAVTTQQTAASMVNQGIFISAATQNFTTGNGTLFLTFGYRVMSGF